MFVPPRNISSQTKYYMVSNFGYMEIPEPNTDNTDKEIAELKARIKELEAAKPKPKDNSEYQFGIKWKEAFVGYSFNGRVLYGEYWFTIFVNDDEMNINLSKEELQTVVTVLQKVIDDGILK